MTNDTEAILIDAVRKIAKRLIDCEQENMALRSLLKRKGLITDFDWKAAVQEIPLAIEADRQRAGQSLTQAMDELLRKFEGPKQ